MKYLHLVAVALISFTMVGCGSDQEKEAATDKLIACDILSKDYMKNRFPGAGGIKTTAREASTSNCTYNFKVGRYSHYIKIELHTGNDEEVLKQSIRNRGEDGVALSGIGKMAFQDKKIGQVNIWTGEHIFQVNVSDGQKYNVKLAAEIARDIVKKL